MEPANVRRDGESGVQRLHTDSGMVYVKRQRNHLFRSLRYPFGLPTVMREKSALHAFSKLGIAIPQLVFAQARHLPDGWKAVLVTRELKDYTDLERWYAQGGRERLGEQLHTAFLQKLGGVLGLMHRNRWQHTCLYPKHIFATAGDNQSLPVIALIDLEKARRRLSAKRCARRDLDQLRRHSPMWSDEDWQVLLAGHSGIFAE